MEFVSQSTQETQQIAADIARETLAKPLGSSAQVIALEGDLGTGKTTFVQGFIRFLGVQEKVKSPTFLIMKEYVVGERSVFHLDCYRMNHSQDLVPLEIDTVFKNPKNIVLVEWAERIADILPTSHTTTRFEHVSETERKITITS